RYGIYVNVNNRHFCRSTFADCVLLRLRLRPWLVQCSDILQPFVALHLDEARGGALELEGFGPRFFCVERIRRRCGADEDAYMLVVEDVDEQNETLGLVASSLADHRDAVDDQRVVTLGDRHIVAHAERLAAKLME